MTQHSLEVGKVVDAHCRLERPLRVGDTSCVWEAEHMRLGGRVAIKFWLDCRDQDARAKTRCERDARALGQIHNPHVVQVLDQGQCDGLPYLVMELLEGEDLGRLLERERTLSLREAANVVDQMCRGLTSIHDAGFVHRDIQPQHVFVIHEQDGGQFVKLLDFGIARIADDCSVGATLTEANVGAPHYWSPEQVEHPLRLDPRADVWAVGAIVYRMLVGLPPFGGHDVLAVCAAIRKGEFAPPQQLDAELPHELEGFFRRAFQRKPGARFASVRDMAEALNDIARAHGAELTRWVESPFALAREPRAPLVERRRVELRYAIAGVVALLMAAVLWATLRSPTRVEMNHRLAPGTDAGRTVEQMPIGKKAALPIHVTKPLAPSEQPAQPPSAASTMPVAGQTRRASPLESSPSAASARPFNEFMQRRTSDDAASTLPLDPRTHRPAPTRPVESQGTPPTAAAKRATNDKAAPENGPKDWGF